MGSLQEVKKFEDLSFGQWKALGTKCDGIEGVLAVLQDEKEIILQEVVQKFFDRHSRRRIIEDLQAKVRDPNRGFRLYQPELKNKAYYAHRIKRLHGCLGVDTNVTAEQLKAETERLLTLIRENSQISNIADGVCLPVILPQLTTDDLGTALEQYLEGVGNSYVKTFSDRKFCNHRKGTLADNVSVVDGSRHNQLIERMKQGPVMGIHFPNPLQGFSINADREQMSTLPEGFILSGLDTVIAMVMYPDILARDYHTPGLELAAFSWQSVDYSLRFGAGGGRLDFDDTDSLANASGCYSGGLLFFLT